jgi:predicted aspartyl protease
MTVRQPRYSKEEFAQRGDEIYESQVRSQIDEEGNRGKIVAIDIETGAFEVADDILPASEHLLARVPDAQTWFVRIGHRSIGRSLWFSESQKNCMMHGVVNQSCEATLPIVVKNNTATKLIDTVIDTGFSGFLTLPLDIISALDLTWKGRDIATLGDGTSCIFEVYIAMVIWDGQLPKRLDRVIKHPTRSHCLSCFLPVRLIKTLS